MQRADLEREKQQANEELAGLLSELVIEPVDSRLEERLRNGLFSLEGNLEDKLKKQFAVVSKTRDLESKFTELGESLEQVSSRLRNGVEGLAQQLVGQSERVQANFLSSQSALQQLSEQLDTACQGFTEASEHGFTKVSAQLEQQITGFQSQLAINEQVHSERAGQLQSELKGLSRQCSASSQHISSIAALLRNDMSALVEQNGKTAASLQLVQDFIQQHQLLMAAQQLEIQRLRQSLQRISWPCLIIGLLIFSAITVVAVQTPAIAALLGLEN